MNGEQIEKALSTATRITISKEGWFVNDEPMSVFIDRLIKNNVNKQPEFFNGDYDAVAVEIINVLGKRSANIDESRKVLDKVIDRLDYQARKCKVNHIG